MLKTEQVLILKVECGSKYTYVDYVTASGFNITGNENNGSSGRFHSDPLYNNRSCDTP